MVLTLNRTNSNGEARNADGPVCLSCIVASSCVQKSLFFLDTANNNDGFFFYADILTFSNNKS